MNLLFQPTRIYTIIPRQLANRRKKRVKRHDVNDDALSVSSKKQNNNLIKLSTKLGLPVGVLPAAGPTQRQLEAMDYDGLTRLRTAPSFSVNHMRQFDKEVFFVSFKLLSFVETTFGS